MIQAALAAGAAVHPNTGAVTDFRMKIEYLGTA